MISFVLLLILVKYPTPTWKSTTCGLSITDAKKIQFLNWLAGGKSRAKMKLASPMFMCEVIGG